MRGLFITYSRIGDAVLSTGILAELVRRNPKIRMTVACGPLAAPLFVETPNVDRVISMQKRKGSLHWCYLWRECVTTKWDVLVDLRNSIVTRLLCSKIRHFGGRSDPSKHRVEYLGALLKMCPVPAPQLWLGDKHEKVAKNLIPEDKPVLAIGPVANWKGKQWDGNRFAELSNRLVGSSGPMKGGKVVILGGKSDRESASSVVDLIPQSQRIDLVGKLGLLEVSAVLRRCQLFVGNDSGLMHVAAASKIPTLGLFGPSREQHYAPWGCRNATVRTKLCYEELIGEPNYDHLTTDSLMSSLSVDAAEDAAIALWKRAYLIEK